MLPRSISKSTRAVLAISMVLSSFMLSLAMLEWMLRSWQRAIRQSDRMDAGLVLYDDFLGWRMASNWTGAHAHYDFDVRYSTNFAGFRGAFVPKGQHDKSAVAFVGDSFTFGLGVDDDETFVHLLSATGAQTHRAHLNFGVIGYSTDQQLLMIQDDVLRFSPGAVFLVVYLGNDLFDNELAFPLQAKQAKPYFELVSGALELRNVPVPLETKSPNRGLSFAAHVLGADPEPQGRLGRYLSQFELFRWVEPHFTASADYSDVFDKRFASTLELFGAIVGQIQAACMERDATLHLVLLPGRSFIETPNALPAHMQDYLRAQIAGNPWGLEMEIIDLAARLRERARQNSETWFHPNEGHLNAAGHRRVADLLSTYIHGDAVYSTHGLPSIRRDALP